MIQTIQPEPRRMDRRKKSRRNVKLFRNEREQLVHWYAFIHRAMQNNIRAKKAEFFALEVKNEDCPMPSEKVRHELKHIFKEDWKCSLSFDCNKKVVYMMDLR